MITIDWALLVLMLAGAASLSASLSMILACLLLGRKREIGLCRICSQKKCDVCMTEGMYAGFEEEK